MFNNINTRYPGIIIRTRQNVVPGMFEGIVLEALAKIYSKPVGKKLIDKIGLYAGINKVYIQRPKEMTWTGSGCGWKSANVAIRFNELNAQKKGEGTTTAIEFNANIINTPDGSRPAFIGLAHELIHAYYNLKGKGMSGPAEENATVGIGSGTQRSINENVIRAEHGLPLRGSYT